MYIIQYKIYIFKCIVLANYNYLSLYNISIVIINIKKKKILLN